MAKVFFEERSECENYAIIFNGEIALRSFIVSTMIKQIVAEAENEFEWH